MGSVQDGPQGFVAIPTHVVRNRDLTLTSRMLFGIVLSYAWGANPCTASTETLCDDAGVGRSAFFAALSQLKGAGLVRVEKGKGWRHIFPTQTGGVRIPDSSSSTESGQPDTEVDEVLSLTAFDVGSSENGDVNPSSSKTEVGAERPAGAREGGRPLRFGGKPVSGEKAQLATAILDRFNEAFRTRYGAVTASGKPSESLSRILGALRDWPDLTLEEAERMIACAAERPWWDGPPATGVVFGPGVVERMRLEASGHEGPRRMSEFQRTQDRLREAYEHARAEEGRA